MKEKDIAQGAIYLSKKDPVLKIVIKSLGKITTPYPKSSPFDKLARSIVGQQLSRKAAGTIWQRINDIFDKKTKLSPENILKTSNHLLHKCGLSKSKVLSIKDLAKHFSDRKITTTRLNKSSEEEVMKMLTEVRGIGEWTAHMFMMFGQGKLDILPTGDLGFRNGFAKAYKIKGVFSIDKITKRAELWRPYRSIATLYLWKYLDKE